MRHVPELSEESISISTTLTNMKTLKRTNVSEILESVPPNKDPYEAASSAPQQEPGINTSRLVRIKAHHYRLKHTL